jgi:multidrug transporter EmrE-like cation transporter
MIFYFLMVFGVLMSSLSQLLLKQSAVLEHKNALFEFLNWRVILSYTVFVAVVLLDIVSLKNGVNVKDIPVIESLGYIFVPVLSYLFFNEHITKRMAGAICVILVGVILFYQ